MNAMVILEAAILQAIRLIDSLFSYLESIWAHFILITDIIRVQKILTVEKGEKKKKNCF